MTNKIPEEVIDYCIDNKCRLSDGLIKFIDDSLDRSDQILNSLKQEIEEDSKAVSQDDMDEIEQMLNQLDK